MYKIKLHEIMLQAAAATAIATTSKVEYEMRTINPIFTLLFIKLHGSLQYNMWK